MSKERPTVGDVWMNKITGVMCYIAFVGSNYVDIITDGSIFIRLTTIHYKDIQDFKNKYTFMFKSKFQVNQLFIEGTLKQ